MNMLWSLYLLPIRRGRCFPWTPRQGCYLSVMFMACLYFGSPAQMCRTANGELVFPYILSQATSDRNWNLHEQINTFHIDVESLMVYLSSDIHDLFFSFFFNLILNNENHQNVGNRSVLQSQYAPSLFCNFLMASKDKPAWTHSPVPGSFWPEIIMCCWIKERERRGRGNILYPIAQYIFQTHVSALVEWICNNPID